MTYLFNDDGLADLLAFIDPATLFAFDLDGTLSPITSDPGSIQVPTAVQQALAKLRKRAIMAIITGRSRLDAQLHLDVIPHYLVGNHGAEGLPGSKRREDSYSLLVRQWAEQLRVMMFDAAAAGMAVENKGTSLSIHYRNAHSRRAAHSLALRAAGRLIPPPKMVGGKCVVNLLPADAPDKGAAMLHLMRRASCAKGFFVGDDRTDEDVFRLDGACLFTIRVGPGTRSRARYFLQDQEEILLLLRHINDALA
ncbi:MAG: trehalose-phosphatase [Desulfobacterales bacterium]|nr:trehalose-phosphatase [Desulfobacterales bacterium]